MDTLFPGMDPYLEHPALWRGVHSRLIVAMASQLRPRIRPRYVASIEERVYIEQGGQERIPDVLIHQVSSRKAAALRPGIEGISTPVVVEVEQLEVRENYISILDRHRDMAVVTVIEVLSPTNKTAGPGQDSYQRKQRNVLDSESHLVEIDLLRRGSHVMSVPETHVKRALYDYMACVNRWPHRNRFELYPSRLRESLPTIGVPLTAPDPDVPFAIQEAFDFVHADGDFMLRVAYDEPCIPPLGDEDQQWAWERWAAYRKTHPDWFSAANGH